MSIIKMILTNGFDPDQRVLKEATYLESIGHDVEIMCWDREQRYKDKEYEIIGTVKIKRFYSPSEYGTKYKQIPSYVNFIRECRIYLKVHNYDYLHCHDLDGAIAGHLANIKRTPIVFDMHEYYVGRSCNRLIQFITKLVVDYMQARSYKIVYVNKTQTKSMSKTNKEKLLYLPNYPVKEDYTQNKTQSSMLRIGYIGSVRQYEQLKMLLEAAKGLSSVQVKIHGAGTALKRLNEIAHLYPNAEVTGKFNPADGPRLYMDIDVLYAVYSCKNNNWKTSYPIKFYESIITKTPIIVAANTIVSKYVKEHSVGFCVQDANEEELRKLLEKISNNSKMLAQLRVNIELLQNDFLWEKVVMVLDDIYM